VLQELAGAPVVHRVFRSSEPDAVHAHVAETFADHELKLGDSGAVRFQLDTATTTGVTVGRMAYGTSAHILGPPMRDCYHVNLLVSGHCIAEHHGERASFSAERGQSGVVFGPNCPVLIDWSADGAQYHLKLPRRAFEDHAARLAGCSPASIDFDLTFPLSSPAGKSLYSSVAFYYSQLASQGGLETMPAVQSELESALMTQVLLVARSNLTPYLLRASTRSDKDSAIRSVIDHIEHAPQSELTIAGLAEMAEVSPRTLQHGFRRLVGVTPSEFIRNTRLDRVHADIVQGNGSAVSEIANRWHFFHLGRFAMHYRERFGESPSSTFRRVAS
jgi:AraC-like DNA-binding protein